MTAPAPATVPAPVLVDDLWRLAADPGAVTTAAQAWRALSIGCATTRETVDEAARPLRGDAWSGDTADALPRPRAAAGRRRG